jgi:hypothetical protein
VSKKADDISQIDKYLNEGLDAKSMHRLERQAQDDPFLMDALEGYESTGRDQQAQLNELAGRLQQRIEKKERRIIPWRLLAAAASVILVCTLGWLWLAKDHSVSTAPVAELIKPGKKGEPVVVEAPVAEQKGAAAMPKEAPKIQKREKNTASVKVPVISQPKTTVPDQLANAPAHDTAVTDTTPLNEMVVMNYAAKRKKDVISSIAANPAGMKKTQPDNNGQVLRSKVEGVTTTPNTNSQYTNSQMTQGTAAGYLLDKFAADNTIKGMVIARDDHLPIPGASVYIKGTKTGVVTDAAGKFTLNADSGKTNLEVASLGYNKALVSTNNKDSLKTIELEPANQSLNEVVVTSALGLHKNSTDASITAAHPKEGWHSFSKYLTNNAASPDGNTGIVKLSITMDGRGNITGTKVIKKLSADCDKKAAGLIKNGPPWVGNSSGKPENVEIIVRFKKQ